MSEVLQVTLGSIWVITLILSFAVICVGAIQPVGFFIVLAIGCSVGALIGETMGGIGWGLAIGLVLMLVLSTMWISRPIQSADES